MTYRTVEWFDVSADVSARFVPRLVVPAVTHYTVRAVKKLSISELSYQLPARLMLACAP